jgi:hypothetical protein
MRALAALLCLAAAGCPSSPAGDGRNPPPLDKHYPDGADGLKQLWSDILVAAQRDDRERVHTLMASLIMSDQDLIDLFGEPLGKRLQPRYVPMIGTLVNIGSMELVATITDRKYDEVEVFPIDEHGSPADRATVAALKQKLPVWGVRVKKKGEARGTRYDFFLYKGGRWVTGNQLSKYLVDQAPDGGAAAPALVRPAKREGEP